MNKLTLALISTTIVWGMGCEESDSRGPATIDYRSPGNSKFNLPHTQPLTVDEKSEALTLLSEMSNIPTDVVAEVSATPAKNSITFTEVNINEEIEKRCDFQVDNYQRGHLYLSIVQSENKFRENCPVQYYFWAKGEQSTSESNFFTNLITIFKYSWIDTPTLHSDLQTIDVTGWITATGSFDETSETAAIALKTEHRGKAKLFNRKDSIDVLLAMHTTMAVNQENVSLESRVYAGVRLEDTWAIAEFIIITEPNGEANIEINLNGEKINPDSLPPPPVDSMTNSIERFANTF